MSIELTDEQYNLCDVLVDWYKHYGRAKPYFYYSGPAGSGKTTVIKYFMEKLGLSNDNVIACAYVGKAVLVLMRHGLNASTIHSLIYNVSFKMEEDVIIDEFGTPKKIRKKKLRFVLKDHLPKSIKLIIVDEAAMVDDKMREDLLSFGIPVIMMGDQNQLPPVIGKSSILDNPDYVLTKIMRQAEGDPIVYLSQCVLHDVPVDYGIYGKSQVVSHIPINDEIVRNYDMIICAKNKTREMLNDRIREDVFHYMDRKPMIGDKIICRKNNWGESLNGIYLTNGLVGYVTDVDYCSLYRNIVYLGFRPDFMEDSFEKLTVDYEFMNASYDMKKSIPFNEKEKFEYAYAITAHLSQGSEYSRVAFIDEKFHDAQTTKRLQYTAITRARDAITWNKREEPKKVYQNYNYNGYKYELKIS